MLLPRTLAAALFVLPLACGGSPPEPATAASSPASDAPKPAAEPESSAAAAEPSAPAATAEPKADAAPAAAAPVSEHASLARDFVKAGGRKIGWSPSKKRFAYPVQRRSGSGGWSLDIRFVDDVGHQLDVMRVCQPGDCEEKFDEIIKGFVPKLASRLEEDGYEPIRAIGWPQERDNLDVSSLGMKLYYKRGTLEGEREKKPRARFTQVGAKRLDTPTLMALFVVPDSKLLGVYASPDGDEMSADFYLLKVP